MDEWVFRLIGLAGIWAAVFLFTRYFSRVLKRWQEHVRQVRVEPRDLKALDRVLDYAAVAAGLVGSFAVLGWNEALYSALTAAGIGGIVVGFAVQDIVANFISGVFILIDRPFVTGDVVEIGEYAGTVQRIALRSTEIATFDGPVVTMPNKLVASSPVKNFSVADRRRVLLTFSLPDDVDVEAVMRLMEATARAEVRLDQERGVSTYVGAIGEGRVDLSLVAYAPTELWWNVQNDLRRALLEAFRAEGIPLAVPVQRILS